MRGGVRAFRTVPTVSALTRAPRVRRYFVIFAVVWMIAMTWRIYPEFKDVLKIDDRLIALDDYVEESCGQRIGPDAQSCIEEAQATGRRLVARRQGKALLFVMAPLLAYAVIDLPWRLALGRRDRTRRLLARKRAKGARGEGSFCDL